MPLSALASFAANDCSSIDDDERKITLLPVANDCSDFAVAVVAALEDDGSGSSASNCSFILRRCEAVNGASFFGGDVDIGESKFFGKRGMLGHESDSSDFVVVLSVGATADASSVRGDGNTPLTLCVASAVCGDDANSDCGRGKRGLLDVGRCSADALDLLLVLLSSLSSFSELVDTIDIGSSSGE